jgi:hypothetical protein
MYKHMRAFLISPVLVVGLLFMIFFLNLLGNIFLWNWTLCCYDSTLHALGGFWVASALLYFFRERFSALNTERNLRVALIVVFAGVLLVAAGWEVFEFLFDVAFAASGTMLKAQPGLADTVSDFIFGAVGGGAYCFLYLSWLMRRRE